MRVVVGVLMLVVIVLIRLIYFYESRTHNLQLKLSSLGWCSISESHRPDYYWIKDWAACLDKLNYEADVAFFGNSITANSNFQECFSDKKIIELGHSGDRIEGMIRRVVMLQSVNPKKIFIMGGINDFYENSHQTIAKRYDELLICLKTTLPNSEVYVQSILPLSSSKQKSYVANITIKKTNELIEKCAEKHGMKYIDLYSRYIENGVMPDSLTYDGLHPNQHAYRMWANEIKAYIYE